MEFGVCRLALGFLRNIVGASAAFLLAGSFIGVGSAEGPAAVKLVAPRPRSNVALISSTRSAHVATAMGAIRQGISIRTVHWLVGSYLMKIEPDLGHVIAPNITPNKDMV